MLGAGVQQPATPKRLPALYLSCRGVPGESPRPLPLMARLIEASEDIRALVFITTNGESHATQLRCTRSDETLVVELQLLLEELGHAAAFHQSHDGLLTRLAAQLFVESPPCIVEVCLGSGMTAGQYRRLGESLCRWRERQVMLICVDQVPDDVDPQLYRSPYDPYWRGLLSQWVEERNWIEALSGSALCTTPSLSSSEQTLVSDNTLCLLHAAFGLGGLRAPERLFGFDLDDNQRALSGYGWMS
ncbi:MAG TPA: hypothetical protein ENI17_06185 [Pseudomonas xinjiangensis]|uniref:Uncharacterized protein n=2 Tax=root TaxID=1 RepID=A0A7V1BR19_9GAMM|nr:hypothetical protein [Halopseudomonas xinjiangensis]HEC47201.1 hypothetical protein [Halopseudomonas xinjiangensis]